MSAEPSGLSRWLALHELSVLVDRNLALARADISGSLVLLIQAPLVGLCIAVAWKEGLDSPGILLFILALVAVWFGAVNASREIVRERPVFLREKRTGVPVRAYLLSKLLVLSLLAAVQCFILTLFVHQTLPGFRISRPALLFTLFAAALAGTAMGLLVSALAKRQSSAVAMIPIILIPQVIFSEAVLGSRSETVKSLENFLPVSWAYGALSELWRVNWSLGELAKALGALSLLTAALLAAAAIALRCARES